MRPIPYGKTSYINILERNFALVDKTRYLEVIENEPSQALLFVRPRRFGKSLFIDLMQCYFDINFKNRFDELFQNSYIHAHKTPMQGRCYILRFDLSGISKDQKAIKKGFTWKIRQGLLRFAQNYSKLQKPLLSILHEENDDPVKLLDRSLQMISPIAKNQILLLIDEYDLLTETFFKEDPDVIKVALENTQFLTEFYTIIKKHCKDALYKVFVSGVSPLAIASTPLTANSFKNISHDPEYACMLGFDEQELRDLISNTIGQGLIGRNTDDVMADMKDYYLGYNFANNAKAPVFNPTQCLYYLNYLAETKQEPVSLFDSNIMGSSARLAAILDACGDDRKVELLIEALINDDCVEIPAITAETEQDFTKKLCFKELIAALMDFGYLTLSNDSSKFRCPNKAMKEQFINLYLHKFCDHAELRFGRNGILTAAYAKLDDGDIKALLSYVSHNLTLACPLATGFNDRSLQLATLMAFIANTRYKARIELEALKKGSSVLLIEEKDNVSSDHRCYLVEFKYLKSSDADEHGVKELAENAKAQLLRYQESENYKHLKKLKKVIAVFAGTNLAHFEEC